MAITIGASTSGSTFTGKTIQVTLPAHSEGDLLLVAAGFNDGARIAGPPPSGWAVLFSDLPIVWWKIAGASEPASVDFDVDQNFASVSWISAAFSGADSFSTSPTDSVTGSTTTSGSFTSESVTPSYDDCKILRLIGKGANSVYTTPGTVTVIENITATSAACLTADSTDGSNGVPSGTEDFTYTPTWHNGQPRRTFTIAPSATGPDPPVFQPFAQPIFRNNPIITG